MASSPVIRIVLIPAGATTWEQDRRLQGATDLPMSETALGHTSSKASAWSPVEPWPKIVHSAPDEASVRTAELFSRALDHVRVKPVEGLAEPSLGLWQGLTTEQIAERHPKVYQRWRQDPYSVTPPEGESLTDAAARLRETVRGLTRRLGDRPLVLVLRPWMRHLAETWLRVTPPGPIQPAQENAREIDPREVEILKSDLDTEPPVASGSPTERRITA